MTIKQFIPQAVVLCYLSTTLHGLEIASFGKQTNERFKNDASFVGFGLDLSGIGRDQSGKWATLISPNVFISADHFRPSGTISFYADNDPSNPAIERNVVSGMQVGNSDLYIGYLDSPVVSSITHYDFATSITGINNTTTVFQTGNPDVDKVGTPGYSSGFSPTTNMVLGLNKFEIHTINTYNSVSSETIWTIQEDSAKSQYTNYESIVQHGDSGSPLFVIDNTNKITILGTAWYKGARNSPFTDPQTRYGSVYTFTAPHTDEINRYIVNQVPEPSSSLLVSISFLLILLKRNR